ncbi:hypothetical protein IU451_15280 [Nocardia cyriacigeorgica]|uniref:pPIWI_RE_Z domain-containing protein n=1 Tax=Nocardia cyriacigeorgica TaxID=135487 RepID=UPI0018950525|nr:hypothetical protein [Nocardia cyriacigeorgica]MBF6323880.1 hypothetical protein [Nocardia cyriacigeorgica]
MRDRTSWHRSVTEALRPHAEEFGEVRPALMCQVELGLRLLERLDPTAPASGVWPLLGGYPFGAAAGLVPGDAEQRLITNARHLLWTMRRNRMWQQSLDVYRSLPERLRGYRLCDNDEPATRSTLFVADDRFAAYDLALEALPPYDRSALPLAPAGAARFVVERRFRTSVTIPEELLFSPKPGHDLTATRAPGPLRIPLTELAATASWMDEKETAADAKPGSWARRFGELELETRTREGTGFEPATELRLDRLTHLVGMVGAGKSTLMTVIAAWGARNGLRTTLVVSDVAEQLALTETFAVLDLPAAPVLGNSTRERHAQRLHRRIASRTGQPILLHEDPGFTYLSTACALDAQRGLEAVEPLRYSDAPCTALYPPTPAPTSDPSSLPAGYRAAETTSTEGDDRLGTAHGCPVWSRCPRHRAAHDLVDADIWVANPASLVQTAVPPHLNAERLRHLELACSRSDIVIVDEADRVQMHLDDTFAPASTLVTRGPESWLDRLGTHKIAELARKGRVQLAERDVERWTAALDVVSATTNRLYALLIDDHELRSWVEIDYFSAWTLQEKLLEDWFPSTSKRQSDDLVEHEEAVFDTNGSAPTSGAHRPHGPVTPWAQRRSDVTACMDAFRDDPLGDRGSHNRVTDLLIRTTHDLLHTQDETRTRTRVRSLLAQLLRGAPELEPTTEKQPSSSARTRKKPDPADIRGSEDWFARTARRLEFTLQLAVLHQRLSRITYLWPHVEAALHLDHTDNELARRPPLDYAPIVPEAPMGNVLGFQYLPDDPDLTYRRAGHCTGTLRFFRCAGVGRELLHALPDLGADPGAGRPGPHVLLMSATSWAGTSTRAHVLAPVQAVLKPHREAVEAVQSTTFRTKFLYDKDNRPITLSGQDQEVRTDVLRQLVSQLGRSPRNGDVSPIEEELAMIGDERRRRALLLVGSYTDARIAFEVLEQFPRWRGQVRVLTRDDADTDGSDGAIGRRGSAVRRGDLASFADDDSAEILIAPLMAIERGHNILSPARTAGGDRVAAFGTVFFLVRPHPQPDDLSLAVFAVNDWVSRYTRDLVAHPDHGTFSQLVAQATDLGQAGRTFRRIARGEWRRLLTRRYIYSRLNTTEQTSFAWDQLVSIWQVIGRLVRGGVHARVVFVDAAFAPATAWNTMPADPATGPGRAPDAGLLVRLRDVLAPYFTADAESGTYADPAEPALVQTLYGPLYNALQNIRLDSQHVPLL